jgi:hypothetical protein
MAAATYSPDAPITGATAAMAELPQMELPQAISVMLWWQTWRNVLPYGRHMGRHTSSIEHVISI